jgi:hypothetical protein
MKKLAALFFIGLSFTLSAQRNKCATDEVLHQYLNNDPSLKQRMHDNEKKVADWIKSNPDFVRNNLKQQGKQLTLTIPVVFHVVYKNAAQNIHDSNLVRQISVLNECFRKQNANFSQTRPIFDTIAADVDIEFCFAAFDPNGNPTNGIIRKSAPSNAAFDPLLNMDKVKSSATNGSDPWNTSQYLNIWVCDMSIFGFTVVLGYATFPGSDPMKDGVVIQYNFIGHQSNGTTNDKGRTTVHEVGHWLGMRHIWGDGQQSTALCDSTDYVDDTPNADSASQQSCMVKNTCSNESPYWTNAGIDPPDMIENYMDYSYDACMTMFTEGQKTRMHGFLNTLRTGLFTSPGSCNFSVGITPGTNTTSNYFQIFPNPAENVITVYSVNENESFDVEIMNALGDVVYEEKDCRNKRTITLEAFNNGVYMIALKLGSSIVVKKFIKN